MASNSEAMIERAHSRTLGRQVASAWLAMGCGAIGICFAAAVPYLRLHGPPGSDVIVQVFVGALSFLFVGIGLFVFHSNKRVHRVTDALRSDLGQIAWYYIHQTDVNVSGLPTDIAVIRVGVGLRDGTRALLATSDDTEAMLAFLSEAAPSAVSRFSKDIERQFKSDPKSLGAEPLCQEQA